MHLDYCNMIGACISITCTDIGHEIEVGNKHLTDISITYQSYIDVNYRYPLHSILSVYIHRLDDRYICIDILIQRYFGCKISADN